MPAVNVTGAPVPVRVNEPAGELKRPLNVVFAVVNELAGAFTTGIFTVSDVRSSVPLLVSVPVPLIVVVPVKVKLMPLVVGWERLVFKVSWAPFLMSSVPVPINDVPAPMVMPAPVLPTLLTVRVCPAAISITPLLVSKDLVNIKVLLVRMEPLLMVFMSMLEP